VSDTNDQRGYADGIVYNDVWKPREHKKSMRFARNIGPLDPNQRVSPNPPCGADCGCPQGL